MAGRRVRAAATETSPTITAPAARLRRTFVGTKNMPKRAITNVVPLNSTARLAVAAVRSDRSLLVEASGPFLTEAGDDEQRVVDAERQSHGGHHVDDEVGKVKCLADQRR